MLIIIPLRVPDGDAEIIQCAEVRVMRAEALRWLFEDSTGLPGRRRDFNVADADDAWRRHAAG